MGRASDTDLILGIILIVLGALVLIGPLKVPFVAEIAGILLIVAGVMVFAKRLGGGNPVLGGVLLALGLLVLVPNVVGEGLGKALDTAVNLAVGIGLIVYGTLKATGRT